MLRQIITPLEPSFTLQFPNDMLGKTVEIIAFEIDEANSEMKRNATGGKEERLAAIRAITKNSLVDMSSFKFNRDEANNYDE